jgi:hypothetical protein
MEMKKLLIVVALLSVVKWPPISRPFFARNKLRIGRSIWFLVRWGQAVVEAVGMWKSRAVGEISKELWETREACLWGFPRFPSAPSFPQLFFRFPSRFSS